jgi:hypothetical protein
MRKAEATMSIITMQNPKLHFQVPSAVALGHDTTSTDVPEELLPSSGWKIQAGKQPSFRCLFRAGCLLNTASTVKMDVIYSFEK